MIPPTASRARLAFRDWSRTQAAQQRDQWTQATVALARTILAGLEPDPEAAKHRDAITQRKEPPP